MRIPIRAIRRFVNGNASDEEKKLVNDWYNSFSDQRVEVPENTEQLKSRIRERLKSSLHTPSPIIIPAEHRIGRRPYRLLAAAAVVAIIFSAGYFLFSHKPAIKNSIVVKSRPVTQPDAVPGTDQAVLTLADGSSILLHKSDTGTIAQQGNTHVVQAVSGQISYQSQSKKSDQILYNTIATPQGGQYQLLLPDGTRVWLNAASSLHFPTAFSGKERTVELSGEGYFEVAPDAEKPFHVKLENNLVVDVLGTNFNVNAYADEASVKTTLIEGMVKLSAPGASQLIHPGQQAAFNPATAAIRLNRDVDVEQVIAWKNGLFQFNSDDIASVMRQLARWYKVTVDWRGKKPEGHFSGVIGRNLPLSKVLEILDQSELHFRIEGQTVILSS